MVSKQKSAFFVTSIFVFLYLVAEPIITEHTRRNSDLIVYTIFTLFSYTVWQIYISLISTPKDVALDLTKNFLKLHLVLQVLGQFVFFSFLSKYNYLDNINAFVNDYKNGNYVGSGFYTFIVIYYMPLLLSFILLKTRKVDPTLCFLTILALINPLLLGMRIFSFPLIFSIFVRLRMKINFVFMLIGIIIFYVLMIYYLASRDGMEIISAIDMTLNRHDLDAIVAPIHEFNIFRGNSIFDIKIIKDAYIDSIPDFYNRISHTIGTTTGIAIPLPTFIFNYLSFFGFPILTFILCIMTFFLKKCITGYTYFKSFLCYTMFLTIFLSLIEDTFFSLTNNSYYLPTFIVSLLFYKLSIQKTKLG